MKGPSMNCLRIICLMLALGFAFSAFGNSTVWVQIDLGNEALVPVRQGADPNFAIEEDGVGETWVGEQFTDENEDGDIDTAKFTWDGDDLATDITVSFLQTSTYDVELIRATQNSSGNLVEEIVGANSITFTLDNLSDTTVKIRLAGPQEPVSCEVVPDANTLTGSPVLWGQAFHTAQRSIINPRDLAYPVNGFNGEVTEEIVDLHVRGRGLDFVWSRRYRSGGFEDSAIGNNWDFSYNISVEGPDDQVPPNAVLHMGNAHSVVFTRTAVRENNDLEVFTADGWEGELTDRFSTGAIQFRFGNGVVWDFNTSGSANGKISTITDRYGNQLSFAYDGSGRLQTITDTLGRDYTVAYDGNGNITSLTEVNGNGRVVDYTHYGVSESGGSVDDLKSVTYPAISGTVTGNDFPSGRSLTYTYDKTVNSPQTGNLLTIQDGRGNTVLSNTYDSSGRVTAQTWGSDGATDAIVALDYPSSPTGLQTGETQKTIVNDGEGNVTEFFYNDANQLLRMVEYTGRAVPNLVTTQTANRPANKLRTSDPATYTTTFTWNTHDLLTERQNPSGNRVVITYGNAAVRTRIAEITRIERFNPGSTQSLREDFTHKNDWTDDMDKFTACRCGEEFVVRHTMRDEGSQVDFDIAFDFDDDGNRTGISYGALSGFPTTFHETFSYNSFGQVTARIHPDNGSGHNRRDEFNYYTSGTQLGYLETFIVDEGTGQLNLTHHFEYDAVGNLRRTALPEGVALGITTGLDDGETNLIYNSNDELIRRQSPVIGGGNTSRNRTDFIYDANGNVTETRVRNRDESGTLQANQDFIDTFAYDSLNRQTQVSEEIDGSTTATTTVAYSRNGLPRLFTFPEAVAGNQPTNTEHRLYDERDLLFKSVQASGNASQLTTQFDYDTNGNLVARTEGLEEASANQRVTSFTYDGFDRLDIATDPLGNETDFGYNGASQVTDTTVRQGGTTTLSDVDFVYDLSGRNTQVNRAFLDSTGSTISGTVNGVATGDGVVNTAFGYTDSFDLETVTFEGNTTTRAYDTANRVATITDPKGNVGTFTYDANSNVTVLDETAVSDVGGQPNQAFQTQFQYDQLDRLTLRRQRYSTASGGLFNDTAFAYDSRNNLVLQTDARGHDSTFTYDGLSRRTASVFELSPGGGTISTATDYDLNSRVVQRTDPSGNATAYEYDALDRLTNVVYADGTAVAFQLNRFGDPMTRTEPTGTVFTNTFDKLGRLTGRSVTPATGFASPGAESFSYDALSRLISATDSDSAVTVEYDSLGNVQEETLQVDGGTVRTTTHTYDDNGNRKRSQYPGGRTLEFTHDTRDRLQSILDATGSPFTLGTYDYVGSRVSRRTYNANGTQLDYVYDGIGSSNPAGDFGVKRPIDTAHTVTSGGSVLDQRTYLWDADQNKLQRKDVRSGGPQLTHDYAYDGRSRLTSQDDGTTVTSFTYDAAGNRTDTGYTLDGSDALLNNYTTTPFESDRGYDLLSNLSQFDARAESYTFDVHNRLTSYVVSGSRTEETPDPGTTWTDLGGGTWVVTNGVLSETTATTARLLRDAAFSMDNDTFTFSYRSPHDPEDTSDFDPERYALAFVRLLEPDAPAEWRYVALVIEPTGLFLREWEDDVLQGELASSSLASEPDTWYDVKIAYSGTNKTDITVSRAKRGNPFEVVFSAVTVSLVEDASQKIGFGVGQLGDYEFKDVIFRDPTDTSETVQVEYKYDALGRRIAKTVDPDGSPTTTEYYYDGPRVIEERDGGGSVQATYVYGRFVDEVLSMQRSGSDFYYHQDDLFNVTAVTNDSGTVVERYEYGAFGEPSFFDGSDTSIGGTAIGNEYLFNGRRCDPETGLYYFRTRYMDPQAGRFIGRDRIGLYGDPNNLGNGQAYVGNNPWTFVDPFGDQRRLDDFLDELENDPARGGGSALSTSTRLGTGISGQAASNPRVREVLEIGAGIDAALNLTPEDRENVEALVSFVPVAGIGADIDLVRKDLQRGKRLQAAIGAIGILPVAGDLVAGGARVLRNADRFGEAAGTTARVGADLARASEPAEKAVSELLGIPRNVGRGRVIVPGSGPGGFRVPDFDPARTIATRGTIVEVKDVQRLSISPQLKDLAAEAIARDVQLEIFTNAPAPLRGELARLIEQRRVILTPLPE